jgi:hypothetical protein
MATHLFQKQKQVRWSLIGGVIAGLCAGTVPFPVHSSLPGYGIPNYGDCGRRLSALDLSAELVVAACGSSRQPDQMAACVVEASQALTGVDQRTILDACRAVRRPQEMATCVSRIGEPAGLALNGCRRSLLPLQFAACVTSLSQRVEVAREAAIASCIDGGDTPRQIFPPYNPI